MTDGRLAKVPNGSAETGLGCEFVDLSGLEPLHDVRGSTLAGCHGFLLP